MADNVSKHTIGFGGNFDRVSTYESFPLFYPFEADFSNLAAFLGTDTAASGPGVICPDPFVIFFQRFSTTTTPLFDETSLAGGPPVYPRGPSSQSIGNQSSDTLRHTST